MHIHRDEIQLDSLHRMQFQHLGNPDVIEKLINRRADVNKETKKGETPLIQAAYAGIRLICYCKIKLFSLSIAFVLVGNDRIATLLIDKWADVNRVSKDGTTALMAAVISGKC